MRKAQIGNNKKYYDYLIIYKILTPRDIVILSEWEFSRNHYRYKNHT